MLERPGAALPDSGALGEILATGWQEDPAQLRAASAGMICPVHQRPMDISASRVRELIASGASAGDLLPDPVWGYIKRTGLYGVQV